MGRFTDWAKIAHNGCPNCGGRMIGDGYTMPIHCENVELPADRECDAAPLFCEDDEEALEWDDILQD